VRIVGQVGNLPPIINRLGGAQEEYQTEKDCRNLGQADLPNRRQVDNLPYKKQPKCQGKRIVAARKETRIRVSGPASGRTNLRNCCLQPPSARAGQRTCPQDPTVFETPELVNNRLWSLAATIWFKFQRWAR
jgi:hypothetical protein